MLVRLFKSAAMACVSLAFAAVVVAQDRPGLSQNAAGRLVYAASADGGRMLDFSHAGYGGGGVPIPTPPDVLRVPVQAGDAWPAIQAALDAMSRRAPDSKGVRGVVRLDRGMYRLSGRLEIAASGVILRGSGTGSDGTLLVAEGADRGPVIRVEGAGGVVSASAGDRDIIAPVAAGGAQLRLSRASDLHTGELVAVRRVSTAAWIHALGMDAFQGWRADARMNWAPGSRDLIWTRRIRSISGETVTLDAPLSFGMGGADAPATLTRIAEDRRIRGVGVENLRLVSAHDPARRTDEDHAWFGIRIDRAEDVWVRDVAFDGFVSFAVNVGPEASRVTVQDVETENPAGERGGYRGRVFNIAGQQVLIQRCASRDGVHDFTLGHAAAGPNVYLDCIAESATGDSGPMESWATGALFDNVVVRGAALRLADRGRDGQGVGWSAGASVLWNCEATSFEADQPPGAPNLAFGCKGVNNGVGVVEAGPTEASRDTNRGGGVSPPSLYRAQLDARIGARGLAALAHAVYPPISPSASVLDPATIAAWTAVQARPRLAGPLRVEAGRFTIDGEPAWRRPVGWSWYLGQMPPSRAVASGPALTRFSPGADGVGATDRIDELAGGLKPGDVFYQHYGLWYDRRRVDHNYFGSPDEPDGETWGPFMELPWARSGQGRAWDGLSKFDLERFNPWYFDRLDAFAEEADRTGRVLYLNFYFQHWLLESRAHYVDFPWRPVNALQRTGLPNEVPAANVFYDVRDPVRRDLHRRYIRHTLDSLRDRSNVVYGIDREYSGPLSFVEFWLDTVAEWSAQNGMRPYIALELPKAQTDALLADPRYRPMITAVGVHDWLYDDRGDLRAIEGGLNKAPREQITALAVAQAQIGEALTAAVQRLWTPTPEMAYRAWREYADGYPGLVFLFPSNRWPELTQAVERSVSAEQRSRTRMSDDVVGDRAQAWVQSAPTGERLVYSLDGAPVRLSGVRAGRWREVWIGGSAPVSREIQLSAESLLVPPTELTGKPWALWLEPVTQSLDERTPAP